jgi:hypothetical protein
MERTLLDIFDQIDRQLHKKCCWQTSLSLAQDHFVCAASTPEPLARLADFFSSDMQATTQVPAWTLFQCEDEQAVTSLNQWAETASPTWDDEPFLGERFLAYTALLSAEQTLALFHQIPEKTGYWVIRRARQIGILTTAHTRYCSRLLLRVLREILYRSWENRGGIALHAAALQWQEHGVLLVGPHGAGKTTLLLDLLRWQQTAYIGNDHVFIACPPDGQGQPQILGGLPLVIRCGQEMLAAKPYLHSFASAERSEEKREITPRALLQALGCRFQGHAPLRALLFPVFSPQTHGVDLTNVSPEQARMLLQQEVYTPTDEQWRRPWILSRDQTEEVLEKQVEALITHLVQILPLLQVRFGPTVQQGGMEPEHPLRTWLSQSCFGEGGI